MSTFIFTPENLIKNIEKLGPWSAYGLASSALKHYFPEEYDENDNCCTQREAELVSKLGCTYWQDVIIKYQTEVGYKTNPEGFYTDFVNEH